MGEVACWRDYLSDEDDAWVAMLRARTRTGRPCGSEDFVATLQERLGRVLLPGKRGKLNDRAAMMARLVKGKVEDEEAAMDGAVGER